jgi:hypothetical protein
MLITGMSTISLAFIRSSCLVPAQHASQDPNQMHDVCHKTYAKFAARLECQWHAFCRSVWIRLTRRGEETPELSSPSETGFYRAFAEAVVQEGVATSGEFLQARTNRGH